jgi:hypothetical protein
VGKPQPVPTAVVVSEKCIHAFGFHNTRVYRRRVWGKCSRS